MAEIKFDVQEAARQILDELLIQSIGELITDKKQRDIFKEILRVMNKHGVPVNTSIDILKDLIIIFNKGE